MLVETKIENRSVVDADFLDDVVFLVCEFVVDAAVEKEVELDATLDGSCEIDEPEVESDVDD